MIYRALKGAGVRIEAQPGGRLRPVPSEQPGGFGRCRAETVIAGGECYPSLTHWRGVAGMRISVSNWSTDAADVERSLAAIAAGLDTPLTMTRGC